MTTTLRRGPRGALLPGVRAVAGWAAAALVVAAVVTALVFRATGGSWFVVRTPSMGTAAPVGSLLVVRPVSGPDVRVGDLLTFRPPTEPQEVYSHRVVAVGPAGFTTRGDINGAPDGWTVRPSDVIGRAVAVLPIAGWGVRGLPVVVAGSLLTWVLTRRARPSWRGAVRVVGVSLSIGVAAALLHPFADMVLLQTTSDRGGVVAEVAGTGVLPVRATAEGGGSVHLVSGGTGTIRIDHPLDGERVRITSRLDLPGWGWALVALVCALPVLIAAALLVARRRSP